jgi:hypothetical protein
MLTVYTLALLLGLSPLLFLALVGVWASILEQRREDDHK